MTYLTVTGAQGRELEVLSTGPSDGFPLVFHNGTPTAATPFPPLQRIADRHNLLIVTYSRPGYAGSSRHEGRSVADAVEDVHAVLDRLDADRYVTLGWSGGGPHALACAALSSRCLAAATLAGVAPHDAEGLDWLAGMGPENLAEFGAAERGAEALTTYLEHDVDQLRHLTADHVAAALGGLVAEVDRRALTGEFAEVMAEMMRRALSAGIDGWLDDDLAFTRHWGFDLTDIRIPVAVWQGGQDRMVPYAHGQWLAAHVPTARVQLFPDEGHLSLIGQLERIVTDLVGLADR